MSEYDVIIPVIKVDFDRCYKNYYLMEKYLPVKKFVFIGPKDLENEIAKFKPTRCDIEFIDENDIIPFQRMKQAFIDRVSRAGYTIAENSRLGWYYQQFLKLSYAEQCLDEYYITWDSDTIPVRNIELFDEEGRPYFDVKVEYFQSYFDTINSLFPGFTKCIDYSFISEHMIFNVNYVKEMINEICKTDFIGETYYEKIINAIEINNLKLGFSEFETYGTYMYKTSRSIYS